MPLTSKVCSTLFLTTRLHHASFHAAMAEYMLILSALESRLSPAKPETVETDLHQLRVAFYRLKRPDFQRFA